MGGAVVHFLYPLGGLGWTLKEAKRKAPAVALDLLKPDRKGSPSSGLRVQGLGSRVYRIQRRVYGVWGLRYIYMCIYIYIYT